MPHNRPRYLTSRFTVILFLSSLYLLAVETYAQWVSLGLEKEAVSSIVVDPRNGNIMYAGSFNDFSAGTYGKIFKSTNAGATWDTVLFGLDVTNLVMHPDSSNILFAMLGFANFTAPGVLKTTNAGISWFRADSGIFLDGEHSVVSVAIDPKKPDVMFVGIVGFGGGWLYKSTNGGARWYPAVDTMGSGLGNGIYAIAIDPESTQYLYTANAQLGDFVKSTDHGETWNIAIYGLAYARAIEFGGTRDTLYIAADYSSRYPKGFIKSTDRGVTWTNNVNGIPGNYGAFLTMVVKRSVSPLELFIGGKTWTRVGSDSGKVWGVFRSENGGDDWKYFGLDSLEIRSLAFSPDERFLYAGVSYAIGQKPLGIYKRDVITEVLNESEEFPRGFHLFQNYPNPFNPSTTISYILKERGAVRLTMYNLFGQRITTLIDEKQVGGYHSVVWNGADEKGNPVSTGVYLLRLLVQSQGL
ncbi:MAG: hypothetical protein HY277_02715, partial [Ignavibacteriales bacterium]|nr:hypothetical protein [Ignavibacteriales bacterium]